ncbi:unnamed protein product [Mytilus coruscus]|uniref:Uncharacterized protein n=1 Tax=Mytilus coruscus TaxID=42192 RepID=A0A6J8AV52_MYTCO|nr:unnamed protein product [Mytilus coruscus]
MSHEDILNVLDPTSDIFDNETTPDDEVDMLEHRIHNLESSISEKERALGKADYDKQGANPKTRVKSKSVESSKPNDLVAIKEKGVDLVDSSEFAQDSSDSELDFSSHLRKRSNKSLKKKSSKVQLQDKDSDSDDSVHVPKVKSVKTNKSKKSGSSSVKKHKSRKNKCSKTSLHKIMIRGVEREVNHFCATCYRLDKLKNHHPECSSACPHHNE